MSVAKSGPTAQSLTNRCIMALQRCGILVTTAHGTVTCLFPPNPNDPHAAPDGEEHTYGETYFTLLVTRTFLELAEEGVIDEDGRPSEAFLNALDSGLQARREGRMRPWNEIRAELVKEGVIDAETGEAV